MTEQEIKRIFELLKNADLFEQVIKSLNRYEIFQLIREIDGKYVNGWINQGEINNFIERYIRSNNVTNRRLDRIIENNIYTMEERIMHLDEKQMYIDKKPHKWIQLAYNHFIRTERYIKVFNKKRNEEELQRNIFFDFKITKNQDIKDLANLNLNEPLYTCSLF